MELILFTIIALLIGLWFSSAQAKERASIAVQLRCDSRGFMLLDQTVALRKLSISRDQSGRMRMRFRYRFDYSISGDERFQGSITIKAGKVVNFALDPHHPIDREINARPYQPFKKGSPSPEIVVNVSFGETPSKKSE